MARRLPSETRRFWYGEASYDVFSFGAIDAVSAAENPGQGELGGRIGSVAAWGPIGGIIRAGESIAALTAEIDAARQEAAGATPDLFQEIEQAKSELAGQISKADADADRAQTKVAAAKTQAQEQFEKLDEAFEQARQKRAADSAASRTKRSEADWDGCVADHIEELRQKLTPPEPMAAGPSFGSLYWHYLVHASFSERLDAFQFALDWAGWIPGVGDALDGLNGVIYLLRGRPRDAGLSFYRWCPWLGMASGREES